MHTLLPALASHASRLLKPSQRADKMSLGVLTGAMVKHRPQEPRQLMAFDGNVGNKQLTQAVSCLIGIR